MVRFNDNGEFIENLTKDRESVDRRIVRVTTLYRQSTFAASIRHLTVVATTRISGELVRLEVYCGDLWGLGKDKPILDKAEALQHILTNRCAELGLEVRSGLLIDHDSTT